MHVLHLLASADRRGAEVFATALADELDRRGHVDTVVALSAGAVGGLDVPVVPALARPAALRELRRTARAADVVLAHGSRGLVAGTASTVASRTPLVYRSIGDPTFWGASTLRRARVGLQLRRAAAVTALWPAAADAIAEQYGVDRAHVHVVPNAADAARFGPADADQRAAARAALDVEAEASVVAVLAALSPEKQVDRIVRAVAAVEGAVLVVAGDGPERAVVADAADRLLPNRHRLLGSVDDVAPVLAAADVVALLSRTEGQPGVVIEAALAGVPAVASRVGGLPSLVDDGRTGVLVDPDADDQAVADALRRALADAAALGVAARETALASWSLDRVADRFEALLVDVVEGRGRP